MLSWKSLQVCAIVNSVLYGMATASSWMFDHSFLAYTGTAIATNVGLVWWLSSIDKQRIEISQTDDFPDSSDVLLTTSMYIVNASCIKSVTHWAILMCMVDTRPTVGVIGCFWYFLMESFVFELVFDGCHYVIHRLLHSNKYLYQIHKTHHRTKDLVAANTFHMHPLDLILSYSVPLVVSTWIFRPTYFHTITAYLTYQEIAGHLGKRMYPTSSFAQFIWLPRLLQIELYTEDHYLHHKLLKCNFSKRFAIWDKLCGTYVPGKCTNSEKLFRSIDGDEPETPDTSKK